MVIVRNELIDLLKGILIILVIIGHIAAPSSLTRYTIDLFHMPMFIGLSGYLFNTSKHKDFTLKQLILKQKERLIIPWVVAVFCYFMLVERPTLINFSIILHLVKSFLAPYYHLWFIPAYISWTALTWILIKNHLSHKATLSIALSISLLFLYLLKYPWIYDKTVISPMIRFILHTLRPQFYLFFVLGIYFRKYMFKWNNTFAILSIIFLFVYTISLFYYPDKTNYILSFVTMNALLLGLMLKVLHVPPQITKTFGMKWVGINSMGIYLWHVVPIYICKALFHFVYSPFYYIVCSLLLFLFLILMTQLIKIRVFNKFLFGMK